MAEIVELNKIVIGDAYVSFEAKNNLEALCAMGSRFGGTPSEKKAVDYILKKFRENGLRTSILWNSDMKDGLEVKLK